MKLTKEQLLAKIAKLELAVDDLLKGDEKQRKEMSTVLGASMGEDYLRHTRTTYSWSQIFCEVGKLIASNEITRLREAMDREYREKQDLSYQLEMATRDSDKR